VALCILRGSTQMRADDGLGALCTFAVGMDLNSVLSLNPIRRARERRIDGRELGPPSAMFVGELEPFW
jgi:hypothetical protein